MIFSGTQGFPARRDGRYQAFLLHICYANQTTNNTTLSTRRKSPLQPPQVSHLLLRRHFHYSRITNKELREIKCQLKIGSLNRTSRSSFQASKKKGYDEVGLERREMTSMPGWRDGANAFYHNKRNNDPGE